jgi:hypothetical protein
MVYFMIHSWDGLSWLVLLWCLSEVVHMAALTGGSAGAASQRQSPPACLMVIRCYQESPGSLCLAFLSIRIAQLFQMESRFQGDKLCAQHFSSSV